MEIFLQINGHRDGPYSLDDIVKRLRNGELPLSMKAWRPGAEGWMSLKDMPDVMDAVVPPATANPKPPIVVSTSTSEVVKEKADQLALETRKKWSATELAVLLILSVIIPLIGLVVGLMGMFSDRKRKQALVLLRVSAVVCLFWWVVASGNNTPQRSVEYASSTVSQAAPRYPYDRQTTLDAYNSFVELYYNYKYQAPDLDLLEKKDFAAFTTQAQEESERNQSQVRKLQMINASGIDPEVKRLISTAEDYFQGVAKYCEQQANIGSAMEKHDSDYQSTGAFVSAFFEGASGDFSRVGKEKTDLDHINAEIDSNNRNHKKLNDDWEVIKQQNENVRSYLAKTYDIAKTK